MVVVGKRLLPKLPLLKHRPLRPLPPKPTEAPAAEEAAPAEDEPLGSTLIGEIEGPTIITDPAAFPTEFNEAPMLAELVAAGELPPVAERLPVPEDLLVIQPLDEIGKYGGTWRRGFTGPGDGQNGHRVAGSDRLLFWDANSFPEMVPQCRQELGSKRGWRHHHRRPAPGHEVV